MELSKTKTYLRKSRIKKEGINLNIVFYGIFLLCILTGAYLISSVYGSKIFNKTKEKIEDFVEDKE